VSFTHSTQVEPTRTCPPGGQLSVAHRGLARVAASAASPMGSIVGVPQHRRSGPVLTPVRGAAALLGVDEGEVLAWIEEGRILWAFDLSLQPGRCRRKYLLIWARCLAHARAGSPCSLGWAELFADVIPDVEELRAVDVQRTINVTETHFHALIRRREIRACTPTRTGPGGSPRLLRFSVEGFFRRRRWPEGLE
jgi:hypothetical protein